MIPSRQIGSLTVFVIVAVSGVTSADEAHLTPFLKTHCLHCHTGDKPKGNFRITLNSDDDWVAILERLELGDMPPKSEPRPPASEVRSVTAWLRAELQRLGRELPDIQDHAFPHHGNAVDHDSLFGKPSDAKPATDARVWRLSPYGYRGLVDGLTGGRLVDKRKNPLIPLPFGLSSDPGFRDYAFRYQISGSETEQMVTNAKKLVEYMFTRHGRWNPPRQFTDIVKSETKPTREQIEIAVTHMFEGVLRRQPSEAELKRYGDFTAANINRFDNHQGLIRGLAPVMLHPEAAFRLELGVGEPDEFGRVMLSPLELATAIAYALTDKRPDDQLLTAMREAKGDPNAIRQAIRAQVARLLADPEIATPRVLRFFQEYFGYTAAPDVFKDDFTLKTAGISGKYYPDQLVEDTDQLVMHIVNQDRNVLRELLTTSKTFVYSGGVEHWLKFQRRREEQARKDGIEPATHPFSHKKNELFKHYNFDPDKWSPTEMPFPLDPQQRAGILTQPAWLIAHSTNTENHAIHRGKWIRERLLGGTIPDTPITVEAKLPEEPDHTLRHRMRVTRDAYCWQCHRHMDPLGLPFEMFDHYGQFRTQELDRPVDTSGEVIDSRDATLDGQVADAVEMIRKLADSPRVHQVFVRHAFRYWLGRNETLNDAPTLQAAYRAYRENDGSLKALIASLISSDSFIYRRPGEPQ